MFVFSVLKKTGLSKTKKNPVFQKQKKLVFFKTEKTKEMNKIILFRIFLVICVMVVIAVAITIPILLSKNDCKKGSGCELKNCGYDSCGNLDGCGKCSDGMFCNQFGICTSGCDKDCGKSVCGDDSCGNIDACGFCAPGEACIGKEKERTCCKKKCNLVRPCGPDGCGGTCGAGDCSEYKDKSKCFNGSCCIPDCDNKTCGTDSCGGVCGTCKENEICENNKCVCVPNCSGKICGDDGCGGSCGNCEKGKTCKDGKCICIPNCKGKVCGDDGCGGSCGTCSKSGETCVNGVCKCGTLDSCATGTSCVKGADGKLKCCPPACSQFTPQTSGTDSCTGQRCNCPVTFKNYRDKCVCGPSRVTCPTGDVCASDKCKNSFNIVTEYGPLTSFVTDTGNGSTGLLINSTNSKILYTTDFRRADDDPYLVDEGQGIIAGYGPLVYYGGKRDEISYGGHLNDLANLYLYKDNKIMYRKPGSDYKYYLGIYKNKKNQYLATPGPAYSGFKVV
jgi:hypothetical protein